MYSVEENFVYLKTKDVYNNDRNDTNTIDSTTNNNRNTNIITTTATNNKYMITI